MKQLTKFAALFLIVVFVFASCKKEVVAVTDQSNNNLPFANAGADQTITLPDIVTIDGRGSKDPDGTIISYSWSQVTGPNQSVLPNSSQVSSKVNNLIQGIYQFELKVTDNGGLSAKDTMQIIVNTIDGCSAITEPIYVSQGNAVLAPFGQLSQPRYALVSATAGNKILFAGGVTCLGSGRVFSTRVDIFNMLTQAWSTAELSQPRDGLTAVGVGNKILFAGGMNNTGLGNSRVDIYDVSSNTWTTAELSIARGFISSASNGGKAFFAGGTISNEIQGSRRVDIYESATNTWSTAELTEDRTEIGAVVVGNKILFAGGLINGSYWGGDLNYSKKIDIYNVSNNTWSSALLSEPRGGITANVLNSKVFFAGGFTDDGGASNNVDIYDDNLQTWAIAGLSQARGGLGSATLGNKILFGMGAGKSGGVSRMDIYDAISNSWTVADLNLPLTLSTVIKAGNQIYVAGGAVKNGISDKVFKLTF
ncbi:MAG: PKD domain-containing protein [Ferruginibacter sp.]